MQTEHYLKRKMKKGILIIGTLLMSNFIFAQNNQAEKSNSKTATPTPAKAEVKLTAAAVPVNNNAADFKFVTEQHDFGTIPEGPQAKFDFEFTNVGKEPLILTDVHASCGCTTPVWSKEPISPGAKSKITAVYNTKGRGGNFTKTITIKSNAKGGDKIVIIKGVVEKAPTVTSPEKAPNVINEMPTKN